MVLGSIILILGIVPAVDQGRLLVLWLPIAILGIGFRSLCRGIEMAPSRRRALDLLPAMMGAAIIAFAVLTPSKGRGIPLVVGLAMVLLCGIPWVVEFVSGRSERSN